MRVTNQMLYSRSADNITSAMDRMYVLQNQASSGKRITQASDDPVGTGQALSLQSSLNSIDQYSSNIDGAKARLDQTDVTLNNISQVLQQSKTLALSAANATADDAQRQSYAVQVQQQIDSLVQEINTTYMGQPLFGGYKTDAIPVTASAGGPTPYQYNGDDGVLHVAVSDSTQIDASITAKEVLNFGGAADPSVPDTLSVLSGLKDALNSGDQGALQTSLKQLDASYQNTVTLRGRMGAQSAQLDVYSSRLADAKTTMSQSLSNIEDVNIADTLTQLQSEQNVYQSSLIAASRISQTSLADYLK